MRAAVHSIDHVALTVPDLDVARRFYQAFGLEARASGAALELYADGHDHCWVSLHEAPGRKRLAYLRYGIYAQDEAVFRARVADAGTACPAPAFAPAEGLWLRGPDGVACCLRVAPKTSPQAKAPALAPDALGEGGRAAPGRGAIGQVRPRHLSHLLCFTPDVERQLAFCEQVLGLRLSDRSGDRIGFVHSPHGSDHHLLAFAKSDGAGLHHTSWDVGGVEQVGLGAEQMRGAGYHRGWGVGRHVLGSNYFYYVQDPWGSFAEYSHDMDHIGAGTDWAAADHAPADSLHLWGPPPPADFITNYETAAQPFSHPQP